MWCLDENKARVTIGDMQLVVDTQRPARGVHDVRRHGAACGIESLLAPRFVDRDTAAQPIAAEAYVRGRDVVVTGSATDPVRLQVYWRIAQSDGCLAALDVNVSVQTPLADVWPALVVESQLAPRALWRITPGTWQATRVALDGPAERIEYPRSASACWLACWPDTQLACALMVHPEDVDEQTLDIAPSVAPAAADETDGFVGPRSVTLADRLFAQPLEKGVILRARCRCAMIAASSDSAIPRLDRDSAEVRALAGAYESFVAAPLPLTA